MSTEKVTYLLELRDKFSKNLNVANQGIDRLEKKSAGASVSLGKMKGLLAGLGLGMVAKEIFTAGINMEQTRVAFATFLKDADKGNKVIAELNEFSNITPFDNAEVIRSGRVLLSAQIPAEKLQETLKGIGDVASGSQVPLTDLASIYAKVMNKGKAQAEELNQLAERGIPILDVLAQKYGTTAAGVMEMGSKGKITKDVIAEAFQTMSSEGGMFFNMMEKQSATTGGKLSTLKGSLGLLAAELGESANPAIAGFLDKLISLTNYLKENKETVIAVVKWVGRGAAAFVAYKTTVFAISKAQQLYNFALGIHNALQVANVKGLRKAKVAMQAFNTATKANPIGLIVSALTIAIPLIIDFINKTDKLTTTEKANLEVSKKANDIFAEKTVKLRRLGTELKSTNLTQKRRKEIIRDLNKSYGEYLPKLLKENASSQELAAALESINLNLRRKARIQASQDILAEKTKELIKLEEILRNEKQITAQATDKWDAKIGIWLTKQFGKEKKYIKDLTAMEWVKLKQKKKNLDEEINAIEKIADTEIKKDAVINSQRKKTYGGGTVGLDKKSKDRLETGIKAGAPKIINVNIEKLVESFNIETKQYKEAPIRVKEEMTKVLLDSINDAVLMQE